MEFHQFVAISVLISAAFVVDGTIKLYRYRKRSEVQQKPWDFRDLKVLRRPRDYPLQEARMVFRSWLACLTLVVMIGVFLVTNPEMPSPAAPDPAAPAAVDKPPVTEEAGAPVR
jgi:hypothetical protein